jgi:poly-gamma-glutamate synthesis protein (capsule biosynthesis protein)
MRLLLFLVFNHFCLSICSQEVSLLFAGDAMQHQSQIQQAYRQGVYDYSSYFRHVREYIASADIAVVNLEAALGGKPYTGYPLFSAPDAFASALKEAGFDLFLTANNHCLDKGKKGLERTIRVLDSLGIKHLGTYKDQESRRMNYPLLWVEKGIRIAFLNYTYGTNGIEVSPPNIVNGIDTLQMGQDMREARETLGADLLVVCMHWGDEYQSVPNKTQEQLAAWLIRRGVDLIIGSHPHVVQPVQVRKNDQGEIAHLVVYSLGNFISGMSRTNTDGGQMIRVVISKENFRTRIKSCTYRLAYVDKRKNGNKTDYRLLSVAQFEDKPDSLPVYSYRKMMLFAGNARELFAKHNAVEVEEDRQEIPSNACPADFPTLEWLPVRSFPRKISSQ